MLGPVQNLRQTAQDSTGTSFAWDAVAFADRYSVSLDGSTLVTVTAPSVKVTAPVGVHSLEVAPLATPTPATKLNFSVPKPVVTFKAPIRGLLDRFGIPQFSFITAYVVSVDMSTMWDGVSGHPLIPGNPLDVALMRGGYALKLRASRAGGAPTAMKTLNGFTPVLVTDATDGTTSTIGPYWTSDYLALYAEFQALLKTNYDSAADLREVTMAEQGLVYDEPFLQYDTAMLPGWSLAAYESSFAAMFSAHRGGSTLQDLAGNPCNAPGAASDYVVTELAAARAAMGLQAVLGNQSIRTPLQSSGDYTAMYAAEKAAGPPLYYQTATAAKVGSLSQTLAWAVTQGANSVEVPVGYNDASVISVAELEQAQAALAANPA